MGEAAEFPGRVFAGGAVEKAVAVAAEVFGVEAGFEWAGVVVSAAVRARAAHDARRFRPSVLVRRPSTISAMSRADSS